MDGFTIGNGNRFLETGKFVDKYSGQQIGSSQSASETAGASFADTLKQAINSVNEVQQKADKAMQNLATGRTDNVAEVMIASEQADIALKLMVQVRNKIIDAYQEVMKMQV